MVDFIVITLLFLDNNYDNNFSKWDNLINIETNSSISKNVYCEINSTPKFELCWYSSTSNSFISETENEKLMDYLDWKHYIYNSEIFEKWFKKNRVLYVEYNNGKYIFKQDESQLNKENIIYSLSNDDWIYKYQLIKKITFWLLLILSVFWAWIFLFPKKTK